MREETMTMFVDRRKRLRAIWAECVGVVEAMCEQATAGMTSDIAWIHATLHAVAVIAWNPKRQKNRSCLPPTWTKEELGKRRSIERFFGRVFLFFHLQRPLLCGWSAVAQQVALTYTATLIVALAAQQAGCPELIRSPKRVLAHTWEALGVRKCPLYSQYQFITTLYYIFL